MLGFVLEAWNIAVSPTSSIPKELQIRKKNGKLTRQLKCRGRSVSTGTSTGSGEIPEEFIHSFIQLIIYLTCLSSIYSAWALCQEQREQWGKERHSLCPRVALSPVEEKDR